MSEEQLLELLREARDLILSHDVNPVIRDNWCARVDTLLRDPVDELVERLTNESFEGYEPGSVTEEEYVARKESIRNAVNYLQYETCWRVELNTTVGQYNRVNWYETTEDDTEENIRATYLTHLHSSRPVRIVSCRRATVAEDLEEFLEEIAEEEGWYE